MTHCLIGGQSLILQFENSEVSSKSTSREITQKDAIIASMQTELQSLEKSVRQLEAENHQLKYQLDTSTHEVASLSSQSNTLEKRLDAERVKVCIYLT